MKIDAAILEANLTIVIASCEYDLTSYTRQITKKQF